MGSFLQTCCVSNQKIEQAYIIPIVVEHDRKVKVKSNSDSSAQILNPISTICYPHDLFKPLGFMFSGKYYDYGRFQIDWNTNLEMFKCFVKYLKENTCITLEGENPYHHLPFDANNELDVNSITLDTAQDIFDTLQEKINKCSVYIKHYFSNGTPQLLKFSSINQYVGDEIENIYKDYLSKNSYVDQPYLKQINTPPQEIKFHLMNLLKNHPVKLIDVFKDYFLSDHDSVYIYNILRCSVDKTNLYTVQTITLLRKLRFIVAGLNIMNVGLKPNIYGGQCYDNEQGILFSKLMDKVKEYNLKYEEDEDDE